MKIIIFGGTGVIGKAVAQELSQRHKIITVGKTTGDYQCDLTDKNQIVQLFKKVGEFDAVISTTGHVHFADFEKMTSELYEIGLQDKLMGQVNLVLIGREYINDKGSFTLTSGILSHDPIRSGTSASMVNGALESFVQAAAIEMPRGLRINIVSPTVILESMPQYAPFFRGYEPIPASRAALAYSKNAEGIQTGQIYRV
jgi:NAD(P)-dependent dehydrogenase (short-subunit alcohol dehydrogenase family)